MAQRKVRTDEASFYRLATNPPLRYASPEPEERVSSGSRDHVSIIMRELEGALQTKRRLRANLCRLLKKSEDD